MIPKKQYYQLNHRIKANELRMVDEKGRQIGVMSKSDAIGLAQERDLDVVLVAPNAKPPVAKLIEFSKFKYQQQQKHAESKKKSKPSDIKEIRFTPFIAEGDFNRRIDQAREFLEDGHKVRLNVKFVGRQITRKKFGEELINKAIQALSEISDIEQEPKFQGKVLRTQLQPKK